MDHAITLLPRFEGLPSRTLYLGAAVGRGLVLTIQLLPPFIGGVETPEFLGKLVADAEAVEAEPEHGPDQPPRRKPREG